MTPHIVFCICAAATVAELIVAIFFTKDPPDQSILKRINSHTGPYAYFSYMTLIPGAGLQSPDDGAKSPIILYEDGKPLGPWRSDLNDIAQKGLGRYLIGGQDGTAYVIFSTSDNSVPMTNGRIYSLCDPESQRNVEAITKTKSRFPVCSPIKK